MGIEIQCVNCPWKWNTDKSEVFDMYVCHKCNFDNSTYYITDYFKNLIG